LEKFQKTKIAMDKWEVKYLNYYDRSYYFSINGVSIGVEITFKDRETYNLIVYIDEFISFQKKFSIPYEKMKVPDLIKSFLKNNKEYLHKWLYKSLLQIQVDKMSKEKLQENINESIMKQKEISFVKYTNDDMRIYSFNNEYEFLVDVWSPSSDKGATIFLRLLNDKDGKYATSYNDKLDFSDGKNVSTAILSSLKNNYQMVMKWIFTSMIRFSKDKQNENTENINEIENITNEPNVKYLTESMGNYSYKVEGNIITLWESFGRILIGLGYVNHRVHLKLSPGDLKEYKRVDNKEDVAILFEKIIKKYWNSAILAYEENEWIKSSLKKWMYSSLIKDHIRIIELEKEKKIKDDLKIKKELARKKRMEKNMISEELNKREPNIKHVRGSVFQVDKEVFLYTWFLGSKDVVIKIPMDFIVDSPNYEKGMFEVTQEEQVQKEKYLKELKDVNNPNVNFINFKIEVLKNHWNEVKPWMYKVFLKRRIDKISDDRKNSND